MRTHHKNKEIPRGRAARACSYCRSRRSRCDGNLDAACDACLQRGIECSFTQLSAGCQRGRPLSPIGHTASPGLSLIQRSESIEKSSVKILPYVQAYFEEFHPCWPFLHRATFDPDHEPAFLLQSVTMIGLWVSDGGQRSAMDLHAHLTRSIYQQRVSYLRNLLRYYLLSVLSVVPRFFFINIGLLDRIDGMHQASVANINNIFMRINPHLQIPGQ